MGLARSAVALTASITLLAGTLLTGTLLAGCFGYNPSAKRWAYVGDSVLIAAGGTTIALDVTSKDAPCTPDAMNNGCSYRSPIHGALIAGIVVVAAGAVGILFNATRDHVKTSR